MAEEFSMVNSLLFIASLVIIGLLLFLYLLPKSKRPRSFGKGRRSTKPGEGAERTSNTITQAPSPQMLAQSMILDETGMIIPEMAVSEPSSDDFRKRIEQGIDSILQSKPAEALEVRIFRKLENLDPNIKKAVLHHIDHLKNFRATYQLYKALDDPNMNMSELSKIIVTDPILTGKILKIANSAYFGMQQKVYSIGHALMIIGLLNIKTVLCQDGLLRLLKAGNSTESFMIDSLWEHATLTSVCASHIQSLFDGLDKGALFTLGLLHDIGKFVLNDLTPTNESTMDPLSVSVGEFTIRHEEKVYGVNHAVVGRLLFDQWGFPEQMGRIIESHHDPSIVGFDSMTLDSKDLKYLLALFLSNQIAKLFTSQDKSTSPIAQLSSYYHPFVQKKRLLGLVLDSSLYSEIKKAKALTKNI
jgi:putative nucleotidyltransferase with HDIG domain